MTAKRLLLAAEFLRGSATLDRLLPLAIALAGRGHDVTLSVPHELSAAVAAAGCPVAEAPRWTAPAPPGFLALSYADLLMHAGYAAPDALRGLLTGWRDVFDRTAPDLMIADLAPTAMLAARLAALPAAAVGDGFSLPPLAAPLPTMRPWADLAPEAVASVEGRVLAVINARLAAAQMPAFQRLRDLFAGVTSYLCTFPELDHYPNRPGGAWFGEVFAPTGGPEPIWPAAAGERAYVELDPRHPAIPPIVGALTRLGLPALIQAAGMPARQADAIDGATVQVTTTPNRASMLSGCDIVICQGKEVAAPALLAGKPLLMLPVFVEQTMTLHRVATQGMGHGVEPDAGADAIGAAVRRLVDDRACRLRAANFARSYEGYRPAIAIDAIADSISDDLAG